MKEKYIELMEKALSAYTHEHILKYFGEVKEKGLSEHGFPRLTANIGILIAHGRRRDLLPLFIEMMDFCCSSIPKVKAANDFSVREIVCCITEIEASGAVAAENINRWKDDLRTIDPLTCYNVYAKSPEDNIRNWALYTAVSEFFRMNAGLGGSMDFIELQIESQLKFFDENGMYLDNPGSDIHQPTMYDLVSRGLCTLLLCFGYRGRFFDKLDDFLRRSALLTLKMQSTTGEMAFGGRSNQFYHNEGWMSTVFEYEAKRYASEGNTELAAKFRSAVVRAVAATERGLSLDPIRHVKNRFPTETKFGCEGYAYFDKYMITAASFLYTAYIVCDDTIPAVMTPDTEPSVFVTSYHFHKIFLKGGGYTVELDTNADSHYDANGVGRIHFADAPSNVAISVPCPEHPVYTVDVDPPKALSFCSGKKCGGRWHFGAADALSYELLSADADDSEARAELICNFEEGSVRESYTVGCGGVDVLFTGKDDIACMLPAFCFDGETHTSIVHEGLRLTVNYLGWRCVYTTNGRIVDLGLKSANRNGHYRAFAAMRSNTLSIKVTIEKI